MMSELPATRSLSEPAIDNAMTLVDGLNNPDADSDENENAGVEEVPSASLKLETIPRLPSTGKDSVRAFAMSLSVEFQFDADITVLGTAGGFGSS